MRPNACMMVSLSKASPGLAVRKRRMPARSGDCTSALNLVSRSGVSDRCVPSLARRAANVTSSTRHLDLAAAGGLAIDLRLILLDQLLHSDRISFAMAVARHRRLAASGLDDHIGEKQVGIDADRGHVNNMYRMFFSAEQLRCVVNHRSGGD